METRRAGGIGPCPRIRQRTVGWSPRPTYGANRPGTVTPSTSTIVPGARPVSSSGRGYGLEK
jgi:hypothetical protein